MKTLHRALLLGLVQLGLVGSLGAKLAYDRSTEPRIWARAVAADPELPMRGRYLELRLEALVRGDAATYGRAVALRAEKGQLVAIPDPLASRPLGSSRVFIWSWSGETALLDPPLAFFIPEHARDPSLRASGEELWAEITVPKKGPARPIRLDVRRRDDPTSAATK
jgi:hypothetical protein